jgi:hypothetical protein
MLGERSATFAEDHIAAAKRRGAMLQRKARATKTAKPKERVAAQPREGGYQTVSLARKVAAQDVHSAFKGSEQMTEDDSTWRSLSAFGNPGGQVKGKNGMTLLTRAQRSALARAVAAARWKTGTRKERPKPKG